MTKRKLYRNKHEIVRCINNSYVAFQKCVGFCKHSYHTGYVTEKVLEKHDCINKKCSYLIPIRTHHYWISLKDQENKKEIERSFKNKESEIKKALPSDINPVMCKHLYDKVYLLIITDTSCDAELPENFFSELDVNVYVASISEDKIESIRHTYSRLIPQEMRDKLMRYKRENIKK